MLWSLLKLIELCQHLYIENQLIPINIYNGIATMPFQLSTVIISTLFHRAKEVCSTKQQLEEEQEHIQQALSSCKYPRWALNRIKKKTRILTQPRNKGKRLTDNNTKSITRRTYITVPYSKGLSESFKNTCKKYGIQVYFRGGKTIKDLLVAPKDRDHITKKSGIIHRYKCDRVGMQ